MITPLKDAAATMELKIKILGGRNAGQEVPIAGPRFLIGRADECQLRPKNDAVSRRHAELVVDGGKATIADLGSRTGTFVDGKVLAREQPHDLRNGQKIRIGALEFEIILTHGLDRQKKPKIGSIGDVATRTAASSSGIVDELDVSQWLSATDDDMDLGETLDGGKDLSDPSIDVPTSGTGPRQEAPANEQKKPELSPGDVASDALRNYLRRR